MSFFQVSDGEPAAETMPFTHVRMEYWSTFSAKEIAEYNTLLECIYFVLKDISIHNCCKAKWMYLFLVLPHTELVLVLNITVAVFIFINFVKIMPGCLYCFEPYLKHPHKKLLRLRTKLCRMLKKKTAIKSLRERCKRAKTSLLKVGNFVF